MEVSPLLVLSVFFFFFISSIHPVHAFHEIHPFFQSLNVVNVSHQHRTGYHFQPKKNWINDPNGPMYYKGIYHLFYQYNPKGATWGNIVWAHSVSKDLINWKALEPAIYPSEPFDKYGCWSGSATIQRNGKPVILYTGIINPKPAPGYQVVNYAIPANYSDPYLRKWIKPANNPIISPTNGENISAWRDPTTAWYQDRHWKILVGGRRKVRGIAYLYKSKDFVRWIKVKHPLHSQRFTGMWECPDFFPVSVVSSHGLDTSTVGEDVKHVLKVSLDATRYEYYTIGSYDHVKEKYIPNNKSVDGWAGLRYDYGNYYASKTFFDPSKERRILWGWANESDTSTEDVAKGWAGIQLIPRTLWMDPGGKQLLQWPIEELKSLRSDHVKLRNVHLRKGNRFEVKGITAAQADVEVTFSFKCLENAEAFDPRWRMLAAQDIAAHVCKERGASVQGGVGPFGLLTLASRNLEEYTPVFFRVFKTDQDGSKHKVLMCSDASSSSLKTGPYKPPFAAFLDVDLGANSRENKISLRSLIDHSVVESFGGGGKVAITSRVYPTLAVSDDAHLYVFNNGSESVTVNTLEAWSMTTPLIS